MAKQPVDPFDVELDREEEREFTAWLCDEITNACNARAAIIQPGGDLDYFQWLYEQGRSPRESLKWDGAADLASPIITEKVDSLRARILRTVFTEPVWVVEGWGKDASRAPFVEEFHQWKQEDERLQSYLAKTVHNALIEGTGILEVIDSHDCRKVTRAKQLAAQLSEAGTVLLDDKANPLPQLDEQGVPVPAEPEGPVLDAVVESYERIRKGPGYRVISLRNFLFLPGHVADKADLFGYAKRFWRRVPDLVTLEQKGEYRNIAHLSTQSDREQATDSLERFGQTIAEQKERTAEKELWEVLVLHDLDGDGIEEWYVATVSTVHRRLLRLRKDDLGLPRYIDLTPFPRTDSLYGYSFAQKLSSMAEEHAARRNMVADRSTLATNAPLMRTQGALWQPKEQPFGPGRVIDVRTKDEITPLVVQDVPASAMVLLNEPIAAAERVAGINDIAAGATPQADRTLGEQQMVTEGSFVRMDEVIKHIQEALEPLFLIRHEIWIRTLAEQQTGMEPPDSLNKTLQARGLHHEAFQGTFTADLLRGNFRGKPRGSVETADTQRLLMAFNGSIQALAQMAQMNPMFGMILSSPEVGKSLLEQWARLYHVQDRQVFLEAANQVVQKLQQQALVQQQLQGMAGGGAAPMATGAPSLLPGLPPDLAGLLTDGAGAPEGLA